MERYSRQVLFQPIGREGQEKLGRARVLLVGCGALGSVLAEILVRAGIGRLTLADRDYVDESNLQRQSLYTEADAREGLPKAVAAVRHLREINSAVEIVERIADVNAQSVASLVQEQDLILDGTDNFETRYLEHSLDLRRMRRKLRVVPGFLAGPDRLSALRSAATSSSGKLSYL